MQGGNDNKKGRPALRVVSPAGGSDGRSSGAVGGQALGEAGAPALERAYVYRDDGIYRIRISPSRDKKRGRARLRWHLDAYYAGHRESTRTSTTFSRQEDAEACGEQLWADYVGGVHSAPEAPPRTLGELIERFTSRDRKKRGGALSSKTKPSYLSHLGTLRRVAGSGCPVIHLTEAHVRAALREPHQIHGGPKSPASIASFLRATKAMTVWAFRKGWLPVDISANVEFDPGPYQMRPFLQSGEFDSYLAACSPSHRIRSGLLLETGLRVTEATHLRWSWILRSVGRPTLQVPAQDTLSGFQAKGRRVRPVPLSERAQAFLVEAAVMWGTTGFVLHNCKKPPLTGNWCRDTHLACKKAGVTDVDTHGLRRSAGTKWLSAGLDIFMVSRLLGHQSVTTTERAYAGIADSRLTAAMDAIDAASKEDAGRGSQRGSRTAPPTAPPNEKRGSGKPEPLEIVEPTSGLEPETC